MRHTRFAAVSCALFIAMGCSEDDGQLQVRVPACGNGIVDEGEACDPAIDPEGCSASCTLLSMDPDMKDGLQLAETENGCGCETTGPAQETGAMLVFLLLIAALGLRRLTPARNRA